FSMRQKFRKDRAAGPRGFATSRFRCIVLMIQYLRNCLEEKPNSGQCVAQPSNKKVLISRFDREPLEGFVQTADSWQNGSVELLTPAGAIQQVPFTDVKAVCFVRDF